MDTGVWLTKSRADIRIQCLCIDTNDPAKTAQFWQAALGWRRLDKWPGERRMVQILNEDERKGRASRFLIGPVVHRGACRLMAGTEFLR